MPASESRLNDHRQVWQLAGPIIIANLSIPLLGAVDTAVMGHQSNPKFLGAVALGALLFNFLYWGFGFLRMGTTGFIAQAFGAGDLDEVRATLARALVLASIVALVVLSFQWPVKLLAFELFHAEQSVEDAAKSYFGIRIWSAPASLVNYVLTGFFLGTRNARAALWQQLSMNGINIVLDLLFVPVLGMGIEGVAVATVIAEIVGVGVGLILMRRILGGLGGHLSRAGTFDRARMLRMVSVNRDIFIRTICLIFGFAYFMDQGAKLGTLVLAANAVLMNFQSIMAYGLDGFAHAVESLAGSAFGAGQRDRFRAYVRACTIWAVGISGLYALAFAVFGGVIVGWLTGIEDVRVEAIAYLPWVIVTPIISVWGFQLDGIFIGATRGQVMRNMMILSLAIFLLATAVLVPLWGNHGLWLSFMIFMAARGISLAVHYKGIERELS